MAIYDEFSDLEYTLYESIAFAMLGSIDTVNPDRSDEFTSFLDDLYLDGRGSDVSGEPGWTIERIPLNAPLGDRFSYIQGRDREDLEAMFLNGEDEAFWIENINSERQRGVLGSSSFWKVTSESFKEFVKNHPARVKELDKARVKYLQLTM